MSECGELHTLSVRETADGPDGSWLSVTQIARLKGVEKSSISRRVKRLVEQDLLEVRPGPGGQKLVKLEAYERASEDATDAIRESNGRNRVGGARPKGSGLAREQARRVAYQADLAEIALAERRGLLLPVDGVSAAVSAASETIVKRLESLPSMTDDLIVAVAKGGAEAVRAVLDDFSRSLMLTACDVFAAVDRASFPESAA